VSGADPNPSGRVDDDAALLDEVSAELASVDLALARLDDGSYGTCEVCGSPLDAADLEADPLLSRCSGHLA
jgi:DnaK suppressor protein